MVCNLVLRWEEQLWEGETTSSFSSLQTLPRAVCKDSTTVTFLFKDRGQEYFFTSGEFHSLVP
jgi:hypothetical protein